MNADKRWVLVAGGSGGVGGAVSRKLAAEGWDVIVGYRSNAESAERVAEDVRSLGREATTVAMDLTEPELTRTVITQTAASRPLSGVVYAAGPHINMKYISELSAEDFSYIIENDLKSCFNLLQPALPYLRETSGVILAVSTPAVKRYAKRDVLSVVPKAGIEALIRGIAVEEGRFGVRANVVEVGLLEGEGMWDQLIARGDYNDELLAIARKNIPLGHFGSADDIADATAFFMSDQSKWVTGQVLAVDGGYST